ncbi:ABC transporter permease [Gordonia sp. NPDC003425]
MSAEGELDSLADSADQLRRLAASAEWDVADARRRLVDAAGEMIADAVADAQGVGAAAASDYWAERARRLTADLAATPAPALGPIADADVVVATAVARAAIAQAALTADRATVSDEETTGAAESRQLIGGVRRAARAVGTETRHELDHVVVGRPHSVLIRLMIALGVSIGVAVVYRVTGFSDKYDSYSALALFLLSVGVGSSICTDALCVDSFHVRDELGGGDPLWRILIGKNLAMLISTLVVGSIVIGVLALVDDDLGLASMFDQLVTMTFIWLGVGNVLSVVYPLRAEPLPARFKDASWKAYLQGFAVSYVVGLAVNLMIYWRLWAKDTASDKLPAGQWGALAAVLTSSVGVWLLLSVLAVVCAQYPPIRRALSREIAAGA